jgi:PilZ domain
MGMFLKRLGSGYIRKAQRHALHFPAYITAGDQSSRVTCIMHDISEAGARLTVGTRHEIPDNFTLVFSRHCRVVRRVEDDGQIGVEFVSGET